MSKTTYYPDRGDIIHVNFGSTGGTREFDGPHFALVLSSVNFSRATGLCIVVPATSKYHHDQRLESTNLMVRIPDLPGLDRNGWIYTQHVRTLDWRERSATFKVKAPPRFVVDIITRVRALIDAASINVAQD